MRDVEAIKEFWGAPEPDGGDPADRLVSIGEFARRSRLSLKALRLYEGLGLVVPDSIDPVTGYRRYLESTLGLARLVAMLRRLDMPLATVAEVVAAPRPLGADLLAAYWCGVEARIASQRELAAHLRIRLSNGEGVSAMVDEVRQREVSEQLVLTEQRHIRVEELPGWLDVAMERVATSAAAYGGMVGPQFVVFHGEVNQDSDGPVEICAPIDPTRTKTTDVPMRREPAHREAYIRLRKAQVCFPQILSAYDAVAAWIQSQGLKIGGPPREIYFTHFASAGPADEVCDVAFPIA